MILNTKLLTWLLFALLSLPTMAQEQTQPASPSIQKSVQKVENAGLLFTDNRAGVSGTDAGYSLPLGKQTLWLFGDVFLLDPSVPSKPYVGAISNCALLVPNGTGTAPLHSYTFLTDPKTGLARQVIPLAPDDGKDVRYWPYGGWYDAEGKRAYLYYARIRVTGGGPFDFRVDGHGLAVADVSTPAPLQFRRLDAAPGQPLWWPGADNAPLFGSAVIENKTENKTENKAVDKPNAKSAYVYVVGVQERNGPKWGKLARVPKARIADFGAYEYYAGGTDTAPDWQPDIRKATDVTGLADFPNELSIAYNAYLGGYLAIHSVGVSDKIRLSLAPHPWGPYTLLAEIGSPHRAFSHAFCYAGKEHPELAQEQGRIVYITYVDSERYWLQLLKITLHK